MLMNQQMFSIKIINETNGETIYYITPQQVSGLKMSVVANGIGNIVVTMPYNQQIWDSFKIDRMLEVSTINNRTGLLQKEETYFLTGKQVYYEGIIQEIVFSGVSLNHLFLRRTIKPTLSDVGSAGGFTTKAGNAADVYEELINEQIINPDNVNRGFSNLTINKVGTGNVVGIRTRYENLLEVMNRIRSNGNVDFRIRRETNEDMVIDIGEIFTDRTYTTNYPFSEFLLFKPELGNAIDPFNEEDFKERKNAVFVLGEGEGSNQFVLPISGAGLSDSPYSRIEDTIEVRNSEGNSSSAAQQALTDGIKFLNDNRANQNFEFEILETPQGNIYREDYDVGDLVTFFWLGELLDFQIKSMTTTVTPANISRTIELELDES